MILETSLQTTPLGVIRLTVLQQFADPYAHESSGFQAAVIHLPLLQTPPITMGLRTSLSKTFSLEWDRTATGPKYPFQTT